MALEKLIQEVEAYRENLVETELPLIPLYRGDKRTLDVIKAAGGFLPKKHGENEPTIDELIQHCIENGYGGPFISTSEDKGIAGEFGANLYRINPGVNPDVRIVEESNWGRLTDYCNRLNTELEAYRKSENPDFMVINTANRHIREINTALNYHGAQREKLVVRRIPMDVIELIS